MAPIRIASVRVVTTESTKITLAAGLASVATFCRSAESDTVLSAKLRRSRETSTTGANPRFARDRPVNKRSRVSLRIMPSGASPIERTATASTREGSGSLRIRGAANVETTGVYATATQIAAIMAAGTQTSGRSRVAPNRAPKMAAGTYSARSGVRSSCCTPSTCAATAARVATIAPLKACRTEGLTAFSTECAAIARLQSGRRQSSMLPEALPTLRKRLVALSLPVPTRPAWRLSGSGDQMRFEPQALARMPQDHRALSAIRATA